MRGSVLDRLFTCFGFGDEPEAFLLVNYLCVKSFAVNHPDSQVIVYYAVEPQQSIWWDRLNDLKNVQKIQVIPPTSVFGNPIIKYAHRTDVFRLHELFDFGGVYFDSDVLNLVSLKKLVKSVPETTETIMCFQSRDKICNAIIIHDLQAGEDFLFDWIKSYETFDGTKWDYHSVCKPAEMRAMGKYTGLYVLPSYFFYYVAWQESSWFFKSGSISELSASYCVHFWNSQCQEKIQEITEDSIRQGRTRIDMLLRKFI
jgi:hypothetical protein